MAEKWEIIRREFKKSDDRRDAGLTTPEGILRFDDIPYGPDGVFQVLDVYRPRAAGDAPLPVIVSVHGGGWVYGTKETYQFYCMDLARRGFAVVNFTYRLAPEHKFPASLRDTRTVFRWTADNAARYGFDASRVFAVGDSAGAHILSLYCAVCVDPAYAGALGLPPSGDLLPAAVALNCGAYHHEMPRPGEAPDLLAAWALPEGGTEREYALVDALRHVTELFPPTFLMTCTDDFLKDDAVLMAGRLAENNVPFLFRFYGDRDHRLGHVFHANVRDPEGRRCNDDECAFFKSFC